MEAVEIIQVDDRFRSIPGTEKRLEADTVCMAVGLTPMIELAYLGGCKMTECPALGGVVPLHNENMQTTNEDIYIAGDISGVEEASTAMEEGRLAGVSAAEALGCLPEAAAEEKKQEIRARLKLLRSGQFGQRRADAKQTIEDTFRQQEEGGEPV